MKIIDFLRKLLEVLWSVPTRLFGSRNERLLKHYSGAVAQINALEPEIAKLPDAALAAKTGELKKRYSEGATLEQLLPEAFAVVREAAKRTLRMRHFDVQLVGGMVLHDGKIAEMKTGEGKTLVATLPARAALRHRRRGRFDPDRRGAHAAHHLRPGRGPHRDLLPHERGRPAPHPAEGGERARRLLGRREKPPDHALGERASEGRGDPGAHRHAAAGREPVRAVLHQPGAPAVCSAARAPPVPSRPALRGAGRPGGHRRRVHRPADAGKALVGRPAPGGGGEGERGDPEREPDARLDHLPELF